MMKICLLISAAKLGHWLRVLSARFLYFIMTIFPSVTIEDFRGDNLRLRK